ncbi:MAG TPA: glycosyltransferase family protein [Kiritimatiellia bacterium]|nr:glycosyltransferase family protein [Kiritimatiellia bacterium]
MSNRKHIAYYISAHGYGHGVRSSDIIRALVRLNPDVRFTLITMLPESFLRNRLPAGDWTFRAASFDVGMVQVDSIRVDVPATLAALTALYAQRTALVKQEVEFLRREKVDLVVADIPAIPLEAAHNARIPGIAVGNFAWDWIYAEFVERDPAWNDLINQIAEGYGCAQLLLRLPFSEPMAAFPRKEDIPVVAVPGLARRAELAAMTGAMTEKQWVLLSFTTLDLDEDALDRIEQLRAYEFFVVRPLEWRRKNIYAIDRERIPFSDVLASADVVISKPGFGLISECVVNHKPLIYADRSDFREYAVLVDSIRRHLRNVHLPTGDLYRGELGGALTEIASQPEAPQPMSAGGDAIAARRILSFVG